MNVSRCLSICLSSLWLCAVAIAADVDATVDFNRDIQPILAKHCYACHGPDEETREADLRLDTAQAATADRDGRVAIKPGSPDESEVVARIESTDTDTVMPPADTGQPLDDEQKQLVRQWIAAGGQYNFHWSFILPSKSAPPQVRQPDWPRHAIDHFVMRRLEQADLTPATEADRYQWIRRVSLDLVGLPPTPEQADAFLADPSDDAYAKVVDRLLDDDAYGEKWARMWLDLARYADTKGYEKDQPREMWKFRQWVIEALNNDMPFDQFTTEQLAGDLLKNPTNDQLIATAFHRNTMNNDEGGTDDEEFRVAAVKDRVDTTIQVWMGLTMGCAKCHSHKYDPISQQQYYSFYAFFNQTEDADRTDDAPTIGSPNEDQQVKIEKLEVQIGALKKQLEAAQPESERAIDRLKTELSALERQLRKIRRQVPRTPIMRELATEKQRPTHVHTRGNFLEKGELVTPAVIDAFGTLPENAPRNRLGVANWLLQTDNPLTARVMVNRIWARLFGIGLVETEGDFGSQGLRPSHPELLDWLAVEFRESGWSIKQLIRSIVLSATYRQSSVITSKKRELDPRNTLLSRGPRFRLSAEMVRDQALTAAGLLTQKIGGPSVMPPQPDGVWKSTYNNRKWQDAQGPDRFRRGIYTYWKRTSPYPAMVTFDAGSGEVCQIRRVRTNTPLQALVTLNDPTFVETAGALGGRMAAFDGTLDAKINHGFRLLLIRPPTIEETSRLVALHQNLTSDFGRDLEAAESLAKSARAPDVAPAMIAVASVLLNLDETLMKP